MAGMWRPQGSTSFLLPLPWRRRAIAAQKIVWEQGAVSKTGRNLMVSKSRKGRAKREDEGAGAEVTVKGVQTAGRAEDRPRP